MRRLGAPVILSAIRAIPPSFRGSSRRWRCRDACGMSAGGRANEFAATKGTKSPCGDSPPRRPEPTQVGLVLFLPRFQPP